MFGQGVPEGGSSNGKDPVCQVLRFLVGGDRGLAPADRRARMGVRWWRSSGVSGGQVMETYRQW